MSKYEWLLFDADNTLLNSSKAFPLAIKESFEAINVECSQALMERYESINNKYWIQFEKGEISLEQIKKERFSTILSGLDIDYEPEAFNLLYLNKLVECTELYEGTIRVLDQLKPHFRMSIITNGMREAQRPRLHKTKITEYFESIIVSDEIGQSKPDIAFFDYTFNSIENPPNKEKTLVIGDGLSSDIQGGINYGLDTCWISNGRENTSKLEATYEIASIRDLPGILR